MWSVSFGAVVVGIEHCATRGRELVSVTIVDQVAGGFPWSSNQWRWPNVGFRGGASETSRADKTWQAAYSLLRRSQFEEITVARSDAETACCW